MKTITIERTLTSDRLPELTPLLGKTVKITVKEKKTALEKHGFAPSKYQAELDEIARKQGVKPIMDIDAFIAKCGGRPDPEFTKIMENVRKHGGKGRQIDL